MSASGGYRLTIGLEIHAELRTRTKMFCACLNNPDEQKPNSNICPVCMAHPGALPVINRDAVHKVLLVGAALGAACADYSEFDRKNYFYPDIPKGYQISQYQHPLVSGGSLREVAITRVHLEEDTARSQHSGDKSLVDYNRAGVPLMELVTEPVIHSAEEAGAFARELQLLLRSLGAGEANMEKGEMRVEANISIAQEGSAELGTKVEVKNLNSFRSVERAIRYEAERQSALLNGGEKVVQETRGWDEVAQKTFSQRKKERAHDYRYFPDPDLPPLRVSALPDFAAEVLRTELPELPAARRERYRVLGLKADDADLFVRETTLGDFFDAAAGILQEKALVLLAANYIANDIVGARLEHKVSAVSLFATLIRMSGEGKLSSRNTKDLLPYVMRGEDPVVIAHREGLLQQNNEGALQTIAQQIISDHAAVAADYKAGKQAALQFLVGQGMKASKGSANPQALREAIQKILG